MGTEQQPVVDDIFSRHPGVFAWAFGIVTGVVFLGMLYRSAGH